MRRWIVLLAGLVVLPLATLAQAAERIVSVNGTLTEIVYALGGAERLVGVDATSQYPSAAQKLPGVGYQRSLSAEGILALAPDLVLATEAAGPPAVLEQLRTVGVEVRIVTAEESIDGVIRKVRRVAELLDLEERGEALVESIRADAAHLEADLARYASRPRVLFLLNVGQGNDLAGGRDTGADAMIRLAGAVNAMADAFEGYKPLTAEAAITATPAVILLTERNLEGLGGSEGILNRAGLAHTPAGRAGRIVALDGLYLLGFGPRTADAARTLARKLRGERGEH